MANFTATARIPCRPLSYDNIAMAENKELIVNYETGNVYIKKSDGTVMDVTSAIKEIVVESMESDPSITQNLIINIEGVEYTLQAAITNNKDAIEANATDIAENKDSIIDLNAALGYRVDTSGEVHFDLLDKVATINPDTGEVSVTVTADEVIETSNRVFVSPSEKTKFNKSTHSEFITATILGGSSNWTGTAAPYSQQITVAGILATDAPVVDIVLGSSSYTTVSNQLDSYAYIYRVVAYNGYIIVYATEPTTVNINIQMKVDR